MLAWLLERALHNHLQHSTPLYASAWKHQLDLTSSSLRRKIFSPSFRRKVLFSSCLLTAAFNSWKYIQRQAKLITPTLIPATDPVKIRSIHKLINSPPPQRLTPTQLLWQEKYKVSWPHVWRRIQAIKFAPHLRALMWRIYNEALPLYRGSTPLANCTHCSQPESTLHIFFDCPSIPSLIATIQPQYERWFGEPLVWEANRILPLIHPKESNASMHLHVLAVIFRLIWFRRNKMKYERKLSPLQHIPAILKAEMTRVITAKWNALLHTIYSPRIQAYKHRTIFNPAPLIAHFKSCWAIPSSFLLKENRIIPL
jgi:hypothetical protein